MERSDAMIHSVIQRRRAALLSLDWDVRIVSQEDDNPLAQEQADFLRMVYDNIDNFREAVSFLFTGFFRGFAHLEKHWSSGGLIERLEPVEQWFWVRDGLFGDWEYNAGAVSGHRRGESIKPENFVALETAALDRILSVLYLRKNLSQTDWDAFLSVYGIPSIFLVGPPNADEAKQKEYQAIAEQILSNGRGFLPHESDIKFVTGGGEKPPFQEQIKYLDEQITIAATGGLLTMLAQPGSGTLAGSAHQDSFLQIAKSDAVTLAGVLQNAIDVPLLAEFFPGQPPLAYFEFSPGLNHATSQVVQDAIDLKTAGMQIDPAELSEKTGYTLEQSQ
jgi:phage gp29-like protein